MEPLYLCIKVIGNSPVDRMLLAKLSNSKSEVAGAYTYAGHILFKFVNTLRQSF